jgi:hypothetical protein
MSLATEIDRIAGERGRSRAELTGELEQAVLAAAAIAWGAGRKLEARFDEAADQVELYQAVRVVETVDRSRSASEIDQASAAALGGELGDELMLQVLYRDQDALAARAQAEQFAALPPIDLIAAGLPFAGPEWMRPLWPQRRMAWRFRQAITLPRLPEALEIFTRGANDAGLSIRTGSAPREDLEAIERLGRHTSDLVALHRRFVVSDDERPPQLRLFGCDLCSIGVALDLRERMNELLAGGEMPEGWWKTSWLPVFGGQRSDTHYCVDLENGGVVRWDRDDLFRPVVAPSLEAWFGLLAVAAESGVLLWNDRMGLSWGVAPLLDELTRLALPGFARDT